MSNENHESAHDGIVELDNRLPNWWLWTLYGSIAFALVYAFYYMVLDGPTLAREYERAHAKLEYENYLNRPPEPPVTHASLLAVIAAPGRAKEGQAIFQTRCASCHGAHGEGGIGPNLTDDYWLHGGQLEQIATTIKNGVLDKGMPAWGPVLGSNDVPSLVAFIRSLRGSKPAGAKAPQGDPAVIKD